MKINQWNRMLAVFTVLIFASSTAFAEMDAAYNQLQNMVEDMQRKMSEMQRTIEKQDDKIRRLEGRGPQLEAPAPVAPSSTGTMTDSEFDAMLNTVTGGGSKWLKDLKFGGDMRLRYEAFDNATGNPAGLRDRNRFRYRLRFGWDKKINDEFNVVFGLGSGEVAGTGVDSGLNVDPTSTNTTFSNDFNYKPIFVEKAFAAYKPMWAKIGPITGAEVAAGKVNNPFEKGSSDIIWDRDVKPEGIYEKADMKLIDTEEFGLNAFATAGQFVLQEVAGGGDGELFGWQAGLNPVFRTDMLERPVSWTTAFSYYDFLDYARNSNFLIGATSLARGNPNVTGPATELDAGDFNILEVYNELGITPFNTPVSLFYDWAMNASNVAPEGSVTDGSYAWAIGTKVGGVKQRGDWEAAYAYKYLGANAATGFNDSDFGQGHSGKVGSVVKLGYGLFDNITLNATAIFANNTNTGTAGIRDEETRRFQLDLNWKF